MKKKLYIFIFICALLGIPLVLLFFHISFTSKNIPLSPFGSIPTSIPANPTNTNRGAFFIINSFPSNNSKNVATDTKVIITFNTSVSAQDFTFSFAPTIDYDATISGNTFTLTPKSPLNPGSIYYYVVTFSEGGSSQKYKFTTTGQGPVSNPGIYDNLRQLQNSWDKSFAPDVYVANHTPYTSGDFSVSSGHRANPPEHYYFSVLLKNTDQNSAKQSFLNWLQSLGLTESQIASLDISYYSANVVIRF